MAAQAALSLLPARKPYPGVWSYAPEGCAALLIVVIGAAGLIPHSWLRQMAESGSISIFYLDCSSAAGS
jgi:hypothetical protein